MLLLDLDDTIFETKSIDPAVFEPAFSIISEYYQSIEPAIVIEAITSELWSKPTDVVFQKYKTPHSIVLKFYEQLERIDHKALQIKTFEDYAVLQSIPQRKILVTTGLRGLQIAKIKALGIESDFEAIKIDDPRLNPRQHKIDIFRQILKVTALPPETIWVIGDNPNSEIKAGRTLGMRTIQRKSSHRSSDSCADYEIESFAELTEIVKC
ncbi:MAG: HAD family hydrolase [Bacteroidota bacterium]